MEIWFCAYEKYKFSMGEKCLKCILMYLDCTKSNETDIDHLHVQKHVSYKKII